jgi:type VI secretion system secreted protein VgrG
MSDMMIRPPFEWLTDAPVEDVQVVRWTASERLSAPFEARVTVSLPQQDDLTAGALVGARSRLVMAGAGATDRRLQGLVSAVRYLAADPVTDRALYELTLRPALSALSHCSNDRIFQDLTVLEVVQAVLDAHGVAHSCRTMREYRPRIYCVQYQESDLAFVERILAEEGIAYHFEDPPADSGLDASEVLVLTDSVHVLRPHDHLEAMPFHPRAMQSTAEEAAEVIQTTRQMQTSNAVLRWYDYTRPTAILESEAGVERSGRTALDAYDYRFEVQKDFEADAGEVHLEQLRAYEQTVTGEGTVRALLVGRRLRLADHPSAAMNRELVVCGLEHEGEARPDADRDAGAGEVYRNRFVLVPADVTVRPSPPPRRMVQVVETARVVGPPGEEIFTDELGRVKVQFHWDREGRGDDHSSCWLRALQPWAGPGWGAQFIPRVGMEVLVSFIGGNVDNPVILGCLYNGTNGMPFAPPEGKTRSGLRTRSTPGGDGANEFSFDDKRDGEQIFLHAQKDFEEVVRANHRRSVGGSEAVQVAGTRQTVIGGDHVRVVQGNEAVTVEQNFALHVVGRQLIEIDAAAGAPPDVPFIEPSLYEVGEMDPDAGLDEIAAQHEVLDAALVVEAVHAPPGIREQADALCQAANDHVHALTDVRSRAHEAIRLSELVLRRAGAGIGRLHDLGLALEIAQKIGPLREELDGYASRAPELLAVPTSGVVPRDGSSSGGHDTLDPPLQQVVSAAQERVELSAREGSPHGDRHPCSGPSRARCGHVGSSPASMVARRVPGHRFLAFGTVTPTSRRALRGISAIHRRGGAA